MGLPAPSPVTMGTSLMALKGLRVVYITLSQPGVQIPLLAKVSSNQDKLEPVL